MKKMFREPKIVAEVIEFSSCVILFYRFNKNKWRKENIYLILQTYTDNNFWIKLCFCLILHYTSGQGSTWKILLIISAGFCSNLSYQNCLSSKEVNKLGVLSQAMYVI